MKFDRERDRERRCAALTWRSSPADQSSLAGKKLGGEGGEGFGFRV